MNRDDLEDLFQRVDSQRESDIEWGDGTEFSRREMVQRIAAGLGAVGIPILLFLQGCFGDRSDTRQLPKEKGEGESKKAAPARKPDVTLDPPSTRIYS